MAAHRAQIHPDETITIEGLAKRMVPYAVAVGVIGIAATVLLGMLDGVKVEHHGHDVPRFYYSYLVAIAYFLSISLGMLWFVILQPLVRARWSVVVRRIAEVVAAGTLPAMLVLTVAGVVLPVFLGYDGAYGHWANSVVQKTDHVIHNKAAWLNPGFFSLRIIVYFLIWWFMARYFFQKSLAQDDSGGTAISEHLRVVSAPSMVVFALSLCFAAFDLLMSVNPHWFSTIFGVYYFAGCAISVFATLSLFAMFLQKCGVLTRSITVEHYHDLGKLLFAFIFFWSYIAFSQFMLIWYANLPEETIWYQPRMFTSWSYLSIWLLVAHCIFPFLCMLSRWTKRILKLLAFFSLWMMFMHYWDIFYIVMPEFDNTGFTFDYSDITALIGVGGIFVAAAAHTAGKVKLIPVRDPNLGASLTFENF